MLSGKVSLVTGASRGIGKAVAIKLASLGSDVAVVYHGNSEKAEETVRNIIESFGIKAIAYKADVSSYEETKELVKKIKEDFSHVDILVNNAGIVKDGLLAMMSEESFDSVIDTNLKGTFNMIRHVCPLMIRAKGGRIINISSVSAIIGNPGQANYSASKAGVIGLTKTAAKELAAKNITVNAVAPGFIKTDMTENIGEDNPLIQMIPLRRFGEAEEVAEAVAFLASSSYITGVVLKVDGGIAM